ncbi:MAG: hypothetical protein ACOC7S_02875 [Planctomycetota bacterium]
MRDATEESEYVRGRRCLLRGLNPDRLIHWLLRPLGTRLAALCLATLILWPLVTAGQEPGSVARELLFTAPLGQIRALDLLPGVPGQQPALALFDQEKMVTVDMSTATVVDEVLLSQTSWRPTVVPLPHAPEFAIMNRGAFLCPPGLMDSQGKTLWRARLRHKHWTPKDGVWTNAMVSGDLNRDGSPEFYVPYFDGLHSFDIDGAL